MFGRTTKWMGRHGFGSLLLLLPLLVGEQILSLQSLEQQAYRLFIHLYELFLDSSNLHASYLYWLPLQWGLYGGIYLFLSRLLPNLSRPAGTARTILLGGAVLLLYFALILFFGIRWPLMGPLLFLLLGYGLWLAIPPGAKPAATCIGPYQLGETLGEGATGKVYLGRDTRTNQEVALKVISPQLQHGSNPSDAEKKRFLRGARIAERLHHPNIVCIHDQGETAEAAYVVMERLTGHSLERYTRTTDGGQLLPLSWVILIVGKVAMALDYAHKNQVVHRDIKPANILFDPATGQIKLMDFCTAQEVNLESETAQAGKSRRVVGTPYYMSPEQLLGRNLDGRSDLFSLGVLFYQLLAGSLPFPAQEMETLLTQITHDPPVDLALLRPDLPHCLHAIIKKALQKKLSQRYQTGRQLTEDLKSCVEGQLLAG
ncbi:MAG: protein kinase [Magnetococcales bacterium]|nr:protein kinase [Magnetococcales bacterium]